MHFVHKQKSAGPKDAPGLAEKPDRVWYVVDHIARYDEVERVAGKGKMECVYSLDIQVIVKCEVGEQQFAAADELTAESGATPDIGAQRVGPEILIHPLKSTAEQQAQISVVILSVIRSGFEDVAFASHSVVRVRGF